MIKMLYIMGDYTQQLVYNLRDALKSYKIDMSFFLYSSRTVLDIPKTPQYTYMYNSTCKLRTPVFYGQRMKNVLREFERWFEKNCKNCNLIHAHMFMSDGILAYEINKKYGIPYMVSVRNTDLNSWFLRVLPFTVYYRDRVLCNAEKIIFPNPSYKYRLIKMVDNNLREIIEEKSIVIPNGIDKYWINNLYLERRKKLGNKITILTVGTIEDNKNQLVVANAIRKLNMEGYNIKYKVIGKILNKSIAEKLNEYPNTVVKGAMPFNQLITEYRKADIYVLISKTETFGLCYPEAMSQGLPIIYSKNEGFDGFYDEGVVGYHVAPKSQYELCEAIKRAIDNYSQLTDNSLRYASTFNWNRIAIMWAKLCEDTIKNNMSLERSNEESSESIQ